MMTLAFIALVGIALAFLGLMVFVTIKLSEV